MDKLNLFEYLIDYNFAAIAQRTGSNITTKQLCDIMNNKSIDTEVQRLGEVTLYVNGDGCFEAEWNKYIKKLGNTTITESGMSK